MDLTAMLCQICYQPKRKVRFQSPRLRICQWCITEINSAACSPDSVIENERLSIETARRLKISDEMRRIEAFQQTLSNNLANELARIPNRAQHEVEGEEGLLQSIFRSVVDNSARLARTSEIATRMRDRAAALYAFSSAESQDKYLLLKLEINAIDAAVAEDLQAFVKSCLAPVPTKLKNARLLRAHAIGLINSTHTQIERPVEPEYDALRRFVRQDDENRCVLCGKDYSSGLLHVHHVISLSKFGTNERNNLVTLCYSCHNAQHEFTVTRSQPIRRAPRQERFIAVDIETTGLSNEDSIIEIGAALFVDGQLKNTFQSFVYTKREIPPSITRLTGITNGNLRTAPKAEDVFGLFKNFIGKTRLVFHNASFDMRFLKRYADHLNCPITNTIHDTLSISRKKLPNIDNHKLATLVEHLQLRVSPTHRAKDDSIATGLLYVRLAGIETPKNANGKVPPKNRAKRKGSGQVITSSIGKDVAVRCADVR